MLVVCSHSEDTASLSLTRKKHMISVSACQHPSYHTVVTRLLPRLDMLDGESLNLRKVKCAARTQNMPDTCLTESTVLLPKWLVVILTPCNTHTTASWNCLC